MSRQTVAKLGTVTLTDNERRELGAITRSLTDRVKASEAVMDSVQTIIKASADAIHDRDLIACLAANQVAMAISACLRNCGEHTGAASIQGTANVVASAANRLNKERQAAS